MISCIKSTYTIPKDCDKVKLDVGLSYNAPHSQLWLEEDDNLMVFGFEPNPESVKNIQKGNIKKRHSSHGEPLNQKYIDEGRFQLIPVALSDTEEETQMEFYINQQDCGTSSLYKPKTQSMGPLKNTTNVPVISLKMFFDEFPWDRFEYIEYLKIDAQGSDLDILKSAGDYLKEKIVYVTAEPDGYQYENAFECNINNIIKYMTGQNFMLLNHPNTKDPTFINKKFFPLKDEVFICQIG